MLDSLCQSALGIFCYSLFPLPFLWLCFSWKASPPSVEVFVERYCAAYGVGLFLLYLSSLWSLESFAGVWAGAATAAFASAKSRRATVACPPWSSSTRTLAAIVLGVFILRLAPAVWIDLPLGWDGNFHLVLADRIAETGRAVFDWMPYETMPLNYPTGSHTLLALLHRFAGISLHKAFLLGLVFFGTATVAQVFALVSRGTGNAEWALCAAAAYGFTAVLGSMGYWYWGGLPNLVGMYLFLGLLGILQNADRSRWETALLFPVLFLAVCFAHHHVMVAAVGILVCVAGASRRKNPELTRRIAIGLACSALAGLPYFLPYFLRSSSLGKTGIGDYGEDTKNLFWFVREFGAVFFFSVATGLVFAWRKKSKYPLSPILWQSLAALVGLLLFLELGCRAAMNIFLHKNVAPFTPSRFITDAVPFLSVFAGLFWLEVKRKMGVSLPAVLGVIALAFCFNGSLYTQGFQKSIRPEYLEAGEWIRHHTDPDAVLLWDALPATYLSRRLTPHLPIPTSEFTALAVNRQRVLAVYHRQLPPSVLGRQVLALSTNAEGPYGKSPTLWSHSSGLKVVEVVPSPHPVN